MTAPRRARRREAAGPAARALALLLGSLLGGGCGGPAIPAPPRPRPIADAETLVRAYYDRVNAEDLPGLLALFVAEPTLVEPFSDPGEATTRRGYRQVARFYAEAFARGEDRVVPEFVEVRGADAIVGWSLASRAGGGYSGLAWFRTRRGLIERLELRRRE